MPTAWRIVKPYRVAKAFSGEGARLYGGRWNSIGVSMVYTAQSKALAALEILVHVDQTELMEDYLCVPVRFSRSMVKDFDISSLPADWRAPLAPGSTRNLGDSWVTGNASVVLAVPSVIIPGESNYLINPHHPEVGALEVGPPEPFEFDPRLLK